MTPHVLDSSKKNTNCFTILSSDAQPKASGRTTSPTNLSSTDQANLRMSAQVYEDHKFVVVAERFQTIENTVSEMKTMLETPKKKTEQELHTITTDEILTLLQQKVGKPIQNLPHKELSH